MNKTRFHQKKETILVTIKYYPFLSQNNKSRQSLPKFCFTTFKDN